MNMCDKSVITVMGFVFKTVPSLRLITLTL